MIKVALTGGIGCGKSTACKLFSQHGTPVIDTDIIARELVEPGKPALSKISDYFGADILLPDGSLNRKALAQKVFNNNKNKDYLESILHPEIRKITQSKINKLDTCYAIIAIPLLVETNQQTDYDYVLVIDCNEAQQIERTIQRDHRRIDQVKSIINAQVSRKKRNSVADDIIDNTQDIKSLEARIKQLHIKYMKLCNSSLP